MLLPRTRTKTIGPRGFFYSCPAAWNNLPSALKILDLSLSVFNKNMKTFHFHNYRFSCNSYIITRYKSARQYLKPYEKNHGNKRNGPSRDSPLTFKQHFSDVPTKSELTRPSADCQTTVFRGIKQLENFLKKVAERSRDSG